MYRSVFRAEHLPSFPPLSLSLSFFLCVPLIFSRLQGRGAPGEHETRNKKFKFSRVR